MKEEKKKMQLPNITVDDFFTTQKEREDLSKEHVEQIDITLIEDFPNHPFKVIMNDEMQDMIDSIDKYGVLIPVLVRPKNNGKYELISGHRRKKASEIANKNSIPCIIRDLSDDEAIIIMVDSNLQREKILPSEKAYAYKMKLEAIKRQSGRPKKNATPMEQNLSGKFSVELLANEIGESREQVRRYIRLTNLLPKLLEMVDNEQIGFRPSVEISYLTTEEQQMLLDCIEYNDCTPSLAQAIQLKKLSQDKKLDFEIMDEIISQEKPNQQEKYKFNRERLSKLLPRNIDENQVEDYVIKAVEFYTKYQRKKQMVR